MSNQNETQDCLPTIERRKLSRTDRTLRAIFGGPRRDPRSRDDDDHGGDASTPPRCRCVNSDCRVVHADRSRTPGTHLCGVASHCPRPKRVAWGIAPKTRSGSYLCRSVRWGKRAPSRVQGAVFLLTADDALKAGQPPLSAALTYAGEGVVWRANPAATLIASGTASARGGARIPLCVNASVSSIQSTTEQRRRTR